RSMVLKAQRAATVNWRFGSTGKRTEPRRGCSQSNARHGTTTRPEPPSRNTLVPRGAAREPLALRASVRAYLRGVLGNETLCDFDRFVRFGQDAARSPVWPLARS